jgi:Oxidoreductase family, NAD-binding Rossmann fold
MKVSLIGAGRNKNGIGEYIGKFFQQNGATVISVLGTKEKSSRGAASSLKQHSIDATPYTDFNKMVEQERPDAVAIASPTLTHYEYLIKSIEAGLHVFCEKPFVLHEKDNIRALLEDIFETADNNNVRIAMNTQWPFSLPYYEELCGPINNQKIDTFFMRLSPISTGKEMIPDSVPHALSILYSIFGEGEIINPDIELHDEDITIKFNYCSSIKTCKVLIRLLTEEFQPRDFSFGFNNKIVKRSLDLESYDIYFSHAHRTLKIVDPLALSVQDFISAVRDQREPLIGKQHIMSNTTLLQQIYDSC